MAFTYVGDGSTDLDKLRFHIGDTTSGSGPLPSSGNLTDEELGWLLTSEGSVDKAVAAAMDAVAVRWSSYADLTVGPRKESYAQIAQAWQDRAARWREDRGVKSATTGSVGFVTRQDGYSEDYSAGDVD